MSAQITKHEKQALKRSLKPKKSPNPALRRMTKTQLDQLDDRVLSFIRSFQLGEGVTPSREEIASHLNLPGLMTAQRAIERLKLKGRISFTKNSKREIETIENQPSPHSGSYPHSQNSPKSGVIELPLLGNVAAGCPIEAIEDLRKIQVPRTLIRGSHHPHFILKVQGDSMVEDHICDGDLVIVRQQAEAPQGALVIALINNEATLKRFYRRSERVELHPANPHYSPILIEPHQHLRILGIYVGLIRTPTCSEA